MSKWVDGLTDEQVWLLDYVKELHEDEIRGNGVTNRGMGDRCHAVRNLLAAFRRKPREWEGWMMWPTDESPDYAITAPLPPDEGEGVFVDGVKPTRVRITEVLED